MPKPWENKSGYPDHTAYRAEKNITDAERRKNDLILIIKKAASLAGFEILNRIELYDRVNDTYYR